jgi:hypothetical protein
LRGRHNDARREPRRELLEFGLHEVALAAGVVQRGERLFTAVHKQLDPAFEGVGVDVEDGADALRILACVEQQDGMQSLSDPPVVGVLVPPPHVVPLTPAQTELLLAHDAHLASPAQRQHIT